MEKNINYNIIAMFISLAKKRCIYELSIHEIHENFKIMKENPKFKGILDKYNFEQSQYSEEINYELANLLAFKKLIYTENKKFVFNNIDDEFEDILFLNVDKNVIATIHEMVNEFVIINTFKNQKQLIKV